MLVSIIYSYICATLSADPRETIISLKFTKTILKARRFLPSSWGGDAVIIAGVAADIKQLNALHFLKIRTRNRFPSHN